MQCRLCSAEPVIRLFEKEGIEYFRCTKCSFVFSVHQVNINLANDLEDYEPAYIQYLEESDEDERNHAALLKWVREHGSFKEQKVLDVGCGSGKLVRFLRREGMEAFGLEPATPLYSKFLSDETYFIQKTAEEFAEGSPEERFGLIFACDVIEHLDRPDQFLKEVSQLLEPGGVLFVSTPDVGSISARMLGKKWHFYNKYHLSFLSRQTIKPMAESCGLVEIGFAHLPRLKSLSYVLTYTSNFILGGRGKKAPKFLDKVVFPINLFDTMSIAFKLPEQEA